MAPKVLGGLRSLGVDSVYKAFALMLLEPLSPADISLATFLFVYRALRRRFDAETIYLAIYAALSLTRHLLPATILSLLYSASLSATLRRVDLLAASILLSSFTVYVVGSVNNVFSYVESLRSFFMGLGPWFIPLHIASASTALILISMETIFKDTKIGRYLTQNTAAYPATQFIALLIAAATKLAMGDEATANRLAEIAYYSLALAVLLALVQVAREGPEEKK